MPSPVLELGRVRQVSPTRSVDEIKSGRVEDFTFALAGRQTISSTVPWSAGERRTSARPAISSSVVRCITETQDGRQVVAATTAFRGRFRTVVWEDLTAHHGVHGNAEVPEA